MTNARRLPHHRVHNPAEIERAIDLLQGRDPPADLAHVLSEQALMFAVNEPETFQDTLAEPLAQLRSESFGAYIIEVSNLRTVTASSDSGPVLVDTVAARSLAEHDAKLAPLYDAGTLRRVRDLTASADAPNDTREAMRRIKKRLARPIVWVSHCGLPEPTPKEEHLALTRRMLADKVSRYAAAMGDMFVDPTTLVAEHGREVFFMQGGRDLYHYTEFGHVELARLIEARLDPLRN